MKVSGFERLGIPGKCTMAWWGRPGATLAFELPIGVEADRAVYVDPGQATAKGLRSWGAAHRWL